jgi:GNAT superfamily N-acetyltransferase
VEIFLSRGASDIEAIRGLFEEYWDSFGFTPCFQNFAEEVRGLPGEYAAPSGALGLAVIDGQPAGCVALRRIDNTRCEAKRLYVRPVFRGHGTGRALLDWVIARARASGYREMLGDTMPIMRQALAMYDYYGFERCEPYSPAPTPGAVYLRLKLG